MKQYTINISEEQEKDFQYLADNQFPNQPHYLCFTISTLEAYLQLLADNGINIVSQYVSTLKDKELLNAVKNDTTLLDSATTKINAIKEAKQLEINNALLADNNVLRELP